MMVDHIFSSYFWSLFGWRAVVEVLFFAAAFYQFARWLRKDSRLLLSFYGYCAVTVIAHFFHLGVIAQVLTLFAPAAVMVFIVLHQDTLQKKFVTVRNITPAQQPHDWLAVLFGTLLASAQKGKTAYVVIEKHDAIKSLLKSSFPLHAHVQKSLLDLLLASDLYDDSKLIWVNHHGELLAINAVWNIEHDAHWISEDVVDLPQWKQDALLLAHKTDALIVCLDPTTRQVEMVGQQKMIERITVAQAMIIMKQYLFGNQPLATEAFTQMRPPLNKQSAVQK